jgi:hypothetical protein
MNENRNRPARSVTRRVFLRSGAAAAVVLSVPSSALARRWQRPSHWLRSSYRPLVGQRFTVRGSKVQLKLTAVHDLNKRQAGSENAFALIFHSPPGAPRLKNQVPQLDHPALGRFKLLISPGEASRNGQPYAAIINRLHG